MRTPGTPLACARSLDVVQPGAFGVVEGDEHLAAGDPPNAALFAELFEQADAAPAEHCLVRAGLVVQARMHDPAVASGLVRREAVLLLEQRHVAHRADA